MKLKPGYKQTEAGMIPEDWNVMRLGHCLSGRPKYGINAPAIPFDSRFPTYLRITDITEDGRFGETTKASVEHPSATSYLLGLGDIVFARTGASVGKSYLYRPEDGLLVFAGFLIRVRPDFVQLMPAYLWFYSQSWAYWHWVRVNSMRSGQPGINGREYASLPIPLPSVKAEQIAIAEALSDADIFIESLQRLLAKKRCVKQGAMQKLLTGKKRLPGFSGNWKKIEFGGAVDRIVGGGTPSRVVGRYWNGDIPWMTVKDFACCNLFETLEYITHEGLENSASHLIPKHTLITPTRMALGKAVILEVDVSINQDLKAVFQSKDIDIRFLYYWFQFNETRIAELGSGSTVMGLSLAELKRIPFLKPQPTEQTAIVAILSDMDAEIAAFEAKLAKARQIKLGMMQELLTGRIRLAPPVSKTIPLPKTKEPDAPATKAHNWQINEAVIIAVLAKTFGSEQYPLARVRCTKLTYLLHRHVEHKAEGYLKKAAGPYNPATKYKGPEGIAQKNKYTRPHNNGTYSGFVAAENIAKAEAYFQQWYGTDVLTWLKQFRYKKTEELELLATVDMAAEDLRRDEKAADLTSVKQIIRNHPEWKAKLDRPIFSDANIAQAILTCRKLFA